MAVKFSDFTQKQLVTDVTNVVGYLTAGELNVMIPPANLDTTYVVSTKNAGASPTINLQGTKPNQPAITPSTVSLTGSGGTLLAGDGSTTIDFASTAYALTSTDTSPAGTVPLVLTGTGGGDAGTDTVSLVGTGTIGITSSGNTITINGTGGGGGSGTVTSIGMAVPAAFAVTPASITTNGTFTISGAGSASQVVLGNGTLGTLPTDTNTTYTVDVPAGTTSINLKGSDATDDPIILVGGTDIGLVRDSANQITINSQAVGGVTSVDEIAAGTSTGIPIIVSPTTGAVKIQSMAFSGAAKVGHVPSSDAAAQTTDFLRADGTWATPASAAPTKTVDQVTIANATTGTVSLTVSPTSEAYTDMYVSGVYQNKSVYSLSGSTITLDSSAYFPNGAIVEVVSTT